MNQQEYFDQQEYFLEKSLKKERRRRTVLLAIPAICFFIALLSNLLEILDIEAETQNALYSQDRVVRIGRFHAWKKPYRKTQKPLT